MPYIQKYRNTYVLLSRGKAHQVFAIMKKMAAEAPSLTLAELERLLGQIRSS